LSVGRSAAWRSPGAPVSRRGEAARPSHRDQLVQGGVDVIDVEVDAVGAIGDHSDATDHRAVLVQRQAAGIGGKPERRALGADAAVGLPAHQVGAGQLRELHAEQRAARLAGLARVEVLLHDLAGGAGGERIALG
jgi:hypothetical protein